MRVLTSRLVAVLSGWRGRRRTGRFSIWNVGDAIETPGLSAAQDAEALSAVGVRLGRDTLREIDVL